MFYRAFVVGIVTFWLAMIFLLARMEWFPKEADSLEVPTAYLWKQMFLHEEASELTVYYQRRRIGSLRLQPHREVLGSAGGGGARQLSAVGNLSADFPWMGRQNVALHGALTLAPTNEVSAVRFSAVFYPPGSQRAAAGTTVMLDGKLPAGVWHYSVQRGDQLLSEETGTVAQLLDRPELRALGIDPTALVKMQEQHASSLTVIARHGQLRLNKDEIETYVVSIKDGSGLETTLHLNQLGQVLAIRTFAGLDLLDGALTP